MGSWFNFGMSNEERKDAGTASLMLGSGVQSLGNILTDLQKGSAQKDGYLAQAATLEENAQQIGKFYTFEEGQARKQAREFRRRERSYISATNLDTGTFQNLIESNIQEDEINASNIRYTGFVKKYDALNAAAYARYNAKVAKKNAKMSAIGQAFMGVGRIASMATGG